MKSQKNLKSTEVKIHSLKASQPQTTEDPFFDFGFDDDNDAFGDDDVWDWDNEVYILFTMNLVIFLSA